MARDMTTSGPTLRSPRWAGDFMSRDHLVPGPFKLNAALFLATDAVVVVVGAAGAAGGATTVPVDALSGPLPNGTLLDFGTNKFARLTAAAAAAATTITVAALPTALVDDDTATYAGTTKKYVPSGTAVGRTIAERDAETGLGPAAAADDEIFLTAFDVDDVAKLADVELYRPNSQVFENYLPEWTDLATAVKTALRARYICTLGRD